MPLYEYYCLDCEQKFEKLVPIEDRDEGVACPSCRGLHTERSLSLFAIRVNGAAGGKAAPSCPLGDGSCRL